MNQHEYVLGCQRYYAENGYEPGNPEDGEWHDCHYPVPKCLGGTETVKLLKQHHAVQGVLQSEEYQRCCIWGWEKAYLDGEPLALARKWQGVRAKANVSKGWANMTPEERSARVSRSVSKGWSKLTPEERAERLPKGAVVVEVTHPDGTTTLHHTATDAAVFTGVSQQLVSRLVRTGRPTRTGYTYRRVN